MLPTLSKKANYILSGTNINRGNKAHEVILPLSPVLAKINGNSASLAWTTMFVRDKTSIKLQRRPMCIIRVLEKHKLPGKTGPTGMLVLLKRNLTEM